MLVVDKVLDEDRLQAPSGTSDIVPTVLPDGNSVTLRPSARDAFSVFEDLCLLANSEKPKFLRLESLPKTFAMELIESTLTNYHNLFYKVCYSPFLLLLYSWLVQHREFLLLLQHNLCPFLLKCLSERPIFPLTLRATRVVFLLLKQFISELQTESEVFFILLIKVVSGENDGDMGSSQAPRPFWMRIMALEAIRGYCPYFHLFFIFSHLILSTQPLHRCRAHAEGLARL